MKGIRFCATGAALPHNSVSNEALSQRVDTSDDWIRSRTGIAARRIAGEGENLTQLASMAGAKALAAAGWDPAS
ncbi:MAG: 3-oxoacyl-ACP synthase, partial [Synechococcaceae bacterium WBB_34_004]|nr:3-oxoacyl-ACP synthase [Synechococcaceae bacterium WBB_34_004]